MMITRNLILTGEPDKVRPLTDANKNLQGSSKMLWVNQILQKKYMLLSWN